MLGIPMVIYTAYGGIRSVTITDGMYAPYCQSGNDALMFANQANDKLAVTKDMKLEPGDVIQFRVGVSVKLLNPQLNKSVGKSV